MRFSVEDFCGRDVRMSIEPENEAEEYQLAAILEKLKATSAHYQLWNDMEGRRGICVVIEKQK